MIDYLLQNTDHILYAGIRNNNTNNLTHIKDNRFNFNLNNSKNIYDTIERITPDYFINFAAQSNVSSR